MDGVISLHFSRPRLIMNAIRKGWLGIANWLRSAFAVHAIWMAITTRWVEMKRTPVRVDRLAVAVSDSSA
jgi:hypothetical protein